MSNSPLIAKFEKLVKDLNTIIFGDDDQDVILDDIVKPTISKWLRSIVTDLNDAIDIAAAAGAGANGWTAQLIVDASGLNQQNINDSRIKTVNSIAELLAIQNPKNGDVVNVLSYNAVNYDLAIPYFAKGGGLFKYDSSKSSVNDGGVVINGWVRQGFSEIDVYMFGAYGNWDATAQTGDDDTIPFQKAVDFLVANGGNPRSSGNRVLKVPVGSFKLSGFTVPQGAAYFSFNLIGEGQFSQLWLNPLGNPINIECENSSFKSMSINGKLTPGEPSDSNPAIPYCIVGKLKNKLLDVDMSFDGVSFGSFATAVRISGRGFVFQNSVAGLGSILCEIALDTDLVVYGPAPEIHALGTALRHFKAYNNRFDVVSTIFRISGSHALKDYINGLTISDCELTLANRLVDSDDCTLVSPKFTDNLGIGCFSRSSSGMVTVPSIKDGLDSDNKWFNYIGDTFTLSRDTGIRYLYRCSNIDGLTISGTTAKDLLYGVVQATESANNIKIHKNNFPNFGNTQNNVYVIDTLVAGVKPTNSSIKDNTFTDNGMYMKNWFSADISGSNSLVVKDNSCSNRFPVQSLTYVPKLRINNTDTTTATYGIQTGRYWVEDNYINARVQLNFTVSATSGIVGVSLPVPAISDNGALSSYVSGAGTVPVLTNFTVTGGVSISVSSSTDQTAKLMISPTTALSMGNHTGGAITIVCEFKYRFR